MFPEEKCMRSRQSRICFAIVIAVFYSDGVVSRPSAVLGKHVLHQESGVMKLGIENAALATKNVNSTSGPRLVKQTRLGDGFWSTQGNRFVDADGKQVNESFIDIMISRQSN